MNVYGVSILVVDIKYGLVLLPCGSCTGEIVSQHT